MLQKLVVALLVFTVIGAIGVGIYDATQKKAGTTPDVLALPAQNETLPVDAANTTVGAAAVPASGVTTQTVAQTVDQPLDQAANQGQGNNANSAAQTGVTQEPPQEQQAQATNMVGETWSGIGIITALDTNGMTLQRADGTEIYVELGPSNYWQGLDVTLTVGEQVTVIGFFNGEQYHSATVIKVDGSQMALRTTDGQPLWSGGGNSGNTTGSNGNTNGNTNGNGNAAEPQVSAEDWVTVGGVVTTVGAQQLTMQAQTGELLDLELGSASFMAEQGVSFATGDPISVLGFWQDGMFRAGEITKTMTNERVMLLDPNGRPLWAGPGRAGNNAGGGNSASTGNAGNSSGNGQSGQGQGGQGQGQNAQGVQVPADEWETVSGIVAQVEPLALTLQVNGKTVYVTLGQVDFWTEQGISFPLGTSLTVNGFWLNGQFEAGIVTFDATGTQLEIRDSFGRLLWTAETGGNGQGGQGQGGNSGNGGNDSGGNGYQGGRNPDFQGGNGNQNG